MQQHQYPRVVFCNNGDCGKPIPIPYSILLVRWPFHEGTNPDAGSENVACPTCGHVSYYTPEDVRPHDADQALAQDQGIRLLVGIVSFGCDEERGEGLVEILLPMPEGSTVQSLLDRSETWTVREVYCKKGKTKGHPARQLPPRHKRTASFAASDRQ
jgi:hypothetical protein